MTTRRFTTAFATAVVLTAAGFTAGCQESPAPAPAAAAAPADPAAAR